MPLEQVFKGIISQYEVRVILNSQGIVFFLYCKNRQRYYQSRIPYLLEGKSKQIQDIFLNLDEFFIYFSQFSEDPQRIHIDDKGIIIVAFVIHKTLRMRPPVVCIPTQILKAGPEIKSESKIHREISDVRRENTLLQKRINDIVQLGESNLVQIEQLKSIIRRKDKKYHDSSESEDEGERRGRGGKKKKRKKYSIISGGQQGVKELEVEIREVSKDIQQINQKIQSTEQLQNTYNIQNKLKPNIDPSMIPEQDYKTEQEIFGQKMIITVDKNNKFLKDHYNIEGNRIEKINKYGRFQLLSEQVIPPTGRWYFVMYIHKISYQIFSLGIVNQKRRNYQNSHESKDLITYFAKTGAIWQYSPTGELPCRTGGGKIPNGVEMRVVVDMDSYQIKWYMDRQELATTRIQKHMQNQRLVAYLEVNYNGNVVYWNQKPDHLN